MNIRQAFKKVFEDECRKKFLGTPKEWMVKGFIYGLKKAAEITSSPTNKLEILSAVKKFEDEEFKNGRKGKTTI